jgi:hypothetical protein
VVIVSEDPSTERRECARCGKQAPAVRARAGFITVSLLLVLVTEEDTDMEPDVRERFAPHRLAGRGALDDDISRIASRRRCVVVGRIGRGMQFEHAVVAALMRFPDVTRRGARILARAGVAGALARHRLARAPAPWRGDRAARGAVAAPCRARALQSRRSARLHAIVR